MSDAPHEIDEIDEMDALRAENAELRGRVAEVDAAIETMRVEALERRAAVRELAESLPTAMSRRALLTKMASDLRHHPDKAGMARRAVAKIGRAPAKLGRIVRDRVRSFRGR